MTKKQIQKKTRQLIRESAQSMRKNIDRILLSGAVDITAYEDNYILPKMIICALLKEEQHQYKPLDNNKQMDKDIENMYLML